MVIDAYRVGQALVPGVGMVVLGLFMLIDPMTIASVSGLTAVGAYLVLGVVADDDGDE